MERLTDRTEEGLICLNNNRNCGFIEQLIKAIDKLAEFEDFIEEQGFEDLQDLERYIEQSIKASELLDKKMKENQALRARWGKLKEWVKNKMETCSNKWYDFEEMFCEMKELEE